MKTLAFSIFFALPFAYSASSHKTCREFTQGRQEAFRMTKTYNRLNELHFDVKVLPGCSLAQTDDVVNVYWTMGKKYGTPCEKPLRKEVRGLIGYDNISELYRRMTVVTSARTLRVNLPQLPKLAKKSGSDRNIPSEVQVELLPQSGKCFIKASMILDGKRVPFNRIHSTIKILKLKKIELYMNSEKLQSL